MSEEKAEYKLKQAQSIVGYSKVRASQDFYPTPEYVTKDIMDVELFEGNVWEPACGDGSMSKVIERFNKVISSDIMDRGYGKTGIDFLLENKSVDNIITNPPFLLAEKFVYHSLKCARFKVAMFLKLSFLEGAKRKIMFEHTPLSSVYVYSKRVSLLRNGEGKGGSGMIAFAWFVWEHGYKDEPVIRWL